MNRAGWRNAFISSISRSGSSWGQSSPRAVRQQNRLPSNAMPAVGNAILRARPLNGDRNARHDPSECGCPSRVSSPKLSGCGRVTMHRKSYKRLAMTGGCAESRPAPLGPWPTGLAREDQTETDAARARRAPARARFSGTSSASMAVRRPPPTRWRARFTPAHRSLWPRRLHGDGPWISVRCLSKNSDARSS